jgi:transposase
MADGGVCGDREQFWRVHVAGWKSSGLSLRLYSEQHGLKAGTLGYWNSRLKDRAAESPSPGSLVSAAGTRFLAVQVAEPVVAVPEPGDARIELALPGGCVVRVGRGFDAEALERLLEVVARRS